MLKVFSVPILKDNYVHIPVNTETLECVIVDPGVAKPVNEFILGHHLKPRGILLTHHHWDHIGGVQELQKSFELQTFSPLKEHKHIPFASDSLKESDRVKLAGFNFEVLDLSGHTEGHIGYWERSQGWLFSGDVLFSLGCGRVFDGTIEEHYQSLQKIKQLPPETWIYCTHEYTELNLRFCQQKLSLNAEEVSALENFAKKVAELRQDLRPTVPFQLKQELELNPFLRVSSFEEFRDLREQRNQF